MARRSLSDLMASAPDIDPEKLDATTEGDIRRYKAAEGYGADYRPAGPMLTVEAPAEIRARLNMTQEAFARALRIPVATLRNWEQGRKLPDPAARSLLNAVAREPEAVLRALGSSTASSTRMPLPEILPTYAVLPVRLPRARRAAVRVVRTEHAFAKVRAVVLTLPEATPPEAVWPRPGEIIAWSGRMGLVDDNMADKSH